MRGLPEPQQWKGSGYGAEFFAEISELRKRNHRVLDDHCGDCMAPMAEIVEVLMGEVTHPMMLQERQRRRKHTTSQDDKNNELSTNEVLTTC